MKRIKYGRLYWLQLEADDIDKFLLVRIFRKLGITYLPWTLKNYSELYLREDRSRYSRRLINRCRQLGIVTYVVQEGPIYHPHQMKWSHLPLYADQFLCPTSDAEMWIEAGMPRDRVKTYDLQKLKQDYRGVLFLEPFVTWEECPDLTVNRRNAAILKTVYDHMDSDMLFCPDSRHAELIRPFLPPHRIVTGEASELAAQYPNLYCFAGGSAQRQLQAAGRVPVLIDQANPLPPAQVRLKFAVPKVTPTIGEGIALLGSFVIWSDLAFTWRRDLHNVRVFSSLAELADEPVRFKPHHAHAEVMLPFLPPDRIVWEHPESLMRRHETIYCFWDSSVRKDCEMIGKTCRLIGEPQSDK